MAEKQQAAAAGKMSNSVYHAFQIIDYLTGKEWCRIVDIASALELDTSTVYRLLNTMKMCEYVRYDEATRRYQLGLKFFTIAYHMLSQNRLINAARPHMEWAAGELCATINLGILNGDKTKVVQIYRLDGDPASRANDIPLGSDKMVNASAIGKCILSCLSFGEQRMILQKLEYGRYTPNTIVTPEALQEELAQIAACGYALDKEEYRSELFCVAFPVFTSEKQVVAAISVSVKEAPSGEYLQKSIYVLREASQRISAAIGLVE